MKKRIFAAIDVSDEARRRVADYIKKLRENFGNVRAAWDKPEKLHLTLKFLGEIEDEEIAKLIEAAHETARQIAPFELRLAGTGVFPSEKRARVLWLGVEDEPGSLKKLNEILESECEKLGLAREKRGFKAHLTIARLKENSIKLVAAHLCENFEPVEFGVSEIVIYQSELRPTGSVYTVISRRDLTGEK